MNDKPMMDNKGYIDVTSAIKLKEAEGRAAVDMKTAESDAMFRELLIRESAKETASKHLAKFAGRNRKVCYHESNMGIFL